MTQHANGSVTKANTASGPTMGVHAQKNNLWVELPNCSGAEGEVALIPGLGNASWANCKPSTPDYKYGEPLPGAEKKKEEEKKEGEEEKKEEEKKEETKTEGEEGKEEEKKETEAALAQKTWVELPNCKSAAGEIALAFNLSNASKATCKSATVPSDSLAQMFHDNKIIKKWVELPKCAGATGEVALIHDLSNASWATCQPKDPHYKYGEPLPGAAPKKEEEKKEETKEEEKKEETKTETLAQNEPRDTHQFPRCQGITGEIPLSNKKDNSSTANCRPVVGTLAQKTWVELPMCSGAVGEVKLSFDKANATAATCQSAPAAPKEEEKKEALTQLLPMPKCTGITGEIPLSTKRDNAASANCTPQNSMAQLLPMPKCTGITGEIPLSAKRDNAASANCTPQNSMAQLLPMPKCTGITGEIPLSTKRSNEASANCTPQNSMAQWVEMKDCTGAAGDVPLNFDLSNATTGANCKPSADATSVIPTEKKHPAEESLSQKKSVPQSRLEEEIALDDW